MSYRRKDTEIEEDAASAVTTVEGRKKYTTVSFMDWADKSHDYSGAKRKSLGLERMGSGLSCGDSSGSGENGFAKMQIYQRQDARVYDVPLLVNFKAADEAAYLQHQHLFLCKEESIKSRYVEEVQGKKIMPCREEDGGVENREISSGEVQSGRIHMFDKAVTPSDVGKLNRLVIPKHHAEKYFPLDANAKDKGLLLTFQDDAGKEWRFRYSYWSSSQSYVLTKGWSRFVREMKLHAGDVVSFHRAAADAQNVEHFYITWKRRASKGPPLFSPFQNSPFQSHSRTRGKAEEWMPYASGPLWAEQLNARPPPPTEAAQAMNWGKLETPQFMKLKPKEQPLSDKSYAAINAVATEPNKRVRLFGVNL